MEDQYADPTKKENASKQFQNYSALAYYLKYTDNQKVKEYLPYDHWITNNIQRAIDLEKIINNPYSTADAVKNAMSELDVVKKALASQNIPIYHEGGEVGSNNGSDFINKLFGVGKDEQIAKLLKGEIVVPPNKFGNLLNNLQNILVNGAKVMAVGGTANTFHINIDKVMGTEEGGKTVVKTIMTELKKLGLQ
jgi:hypothetical protein